MEEIIVNISSPAWWVTAIVAGVVASLTASYSKPILDKMFSRVSSHYKNKVAEKKAENTAFITKLMGDKDEQILAMLTVNHHRLRAIGFLVLSVIFMIMFTYLSNIGAASSWIMLTVGGLSTILVLLSLTDVLNAQKLLEKIERARASNDT